MGRRFIPRLFPGIRHVSVLCFLIAAAGSTTVPTAAAGQEVELHLKVQPGMRSTGDNQYRVSLRTSSGRYSRIATARRGARLNFKHLEPDIYLICAKDNLDREQCKSIDMFAPQDHKKHEFSAEITDPMPNTADAHSVTLQQLKIPDKARKELSLSIKAYIQGKTGEMEAHLKRAVEIDPSFFEALNNLGFYYLSRGDAALSIKYFARAVELNPNFATGWSNLGGALLMNKQWEEALKVISRSLRVRPNSIAANSQAAYACYQTHRYPEAEKYYNKVLSLDPESSTFPMLSLARIALGQNRELEAEDYVRMFLKIHPNAPDAPALMRSLRTMESGTLMKALSSIAENRP